MIMTHNSILQAVDGLFKKNRTEPLIIIHHPALLRPPRPESDGGRQITPVFACLHYPDELYSVSTKTGGAL